MIFYFSATGNSQYVAKTIAKKTNDRLVSIRQYLNKKDVEFEINDHENIGLVIPTFFQGVPLFVKEFFKNIKLKITGDDHYCYSVSTCGVSYGNSGSQCKSLFEKIGLDIDATYCVHMVDNWVPHFDLNDQDYINETEKKAEAELKDVCDHIIKKTKLYIPDHFDHEKEIERGHAYEESRKTELFFVNDSCIGCGKCMRQCPINAIEINDKKPQWIKDKCLLCLGCVHICPKNAIAYTESTIGHGQYHNLHIKEIK